MAWGEKRFESYKKLQEDRIDQLAYARLQEGRQPFFWLGQLSGKVIPFHWDKEHSRGRCCLLVEGGWAGSKRINSVWYLLLEQLRSKCLNSSQMKEALQLQGGEAGSPDFCTFTLERGISLGPPQLLSGWGWEGAGHDTHDWHFDLGSLKPFKIHI